MSPRIIFHSENGPEIGGSDLLMGNLADAVAARGWSVLAMVSDHYPLDTVFRNSHPTVLGECTATRSQTSPSETTAHPQMLSKRQPLRRVLGKQIPLSWRRRLGYERTARRTCKAVRAAQADLFVSMDGGPQPTVIGARRAGCRTVSIYNAPPPEKAGDSLTLHCAKRSHRSSDACMSPSDYCSRQWAGYLGVPLSSVPTIANGVVLPYRDHDTRTRIRKELGIPPDAIIVGMTGRLEAIKGPMVLVEAIVKIKSLRPSTVVVFTGMGSQRQAIESALQQSGVSYRMPGFRKDATDFPAAYDIAVVPSTFAEPFGLVVAEAMAWGTPVVASRVGGIPEVVGTSCGLLVPPENPTALGEAIGQLIDSPNLRMQLGTAGRRRVEELFTLERQMESYFTLFESLLRRVR